jgi:hypothetical protein
MNFPVSVPQSRFSHVFSGKRSPILFFLKIISQQTSSFSDVRECSGRGAVQSRELYESDSVQSAVLLALPALPKTNEMNDTD